MKKNKPIPADTRECLKTVTANSFVTACGLEKISLKARKLLYLAISQCKRTDKQFYEYSISALEFANLMEISASNVYAEADKITDELMHGFITQRKESKKPTFSKYHLFSKCEYTEDANLVFKLNPDMTEFLLELKGNFCQPLLDDFVKMNSPYSMAIWHLIQMKTKSKKPGIVDVIEFDLFLEELREVTGTEDKLKQLVEFKRRVFDKALREIKENCSVEITYTNIKKGRSVVGFRCRAVSVFHVDEADIPKHVRDKAELFKLKQKAKKGEMTAEEREAYDRLIVGAEQMELFQEG